MRSKTGSDNPGACNFLRAGGIFAAYALAASFAAGVAIADTATAHPATVVSTPPTQPVVEKIGTAYFATIGTLPLEQAKQSPAKSSAKPKSMLTKQLFDDPSAKIIVRFHRDSRKPVAGVVKGGYRCLARKSS